MAGEGQGHTCTASQPVTLMPWGVWQQVAPQDRAGVLLASLYRGEPTDTPSLAWSISGTDKMGVTEGPLPPATLG